MYEGEEAIKEDWDEDKYRMGQRVENFGNDVENFPEIAAYPDNAVDNVENPDIPEDVAGWSRNKVGEAEYDAGGDDARYDHDDNYGGDDGGDGGGW
ncbi:hypothetical protein EJ05DRAFT_505750 [Pseudovirgaria hyperparasitica]|uniref:Uncharacterized protein n=1 Tax=Pseudovirgaria hyperparasitica TaxID=470096 RepID=A0A6A6VSN6_9PEZI|nr:uncharacterized protein EJ05DRAFT_505750 [Pseudovirgaria hyperparasitica]KAF2752774.1 hypothetical protein EJ05DRAFT_505750 [Pseudovirgaria hyperparasitica]